jgi:hypothetical protein
MLAWLKPLTLVSKSVPASTRNYIAANAWRILILA